MLVEKQVVKVTWNGNNRKLYEELGYPFTSYNQEFEVRIEHLAKKSAKEVWVICDYCGEKFKRKYSSVNRRDSKHFCNKECKESSENINGYNRMERIDKSLDGLIYLFSILERVPKVLEYDEFAKEKGLLQRRNLEVRLNKKWNEICMNILGDANQYGFTKEDLLYKLANLYNELGYTPTLYDIEEAICEKKQFYRKFNMTYYELINKLGWELPQNFICFDKNGELCRSHCEMLISNLLIDNNIEFIKELEYHSLVDWLEKKWRFDWYIPQLNICIEYFGLYNESKINEDNLIGNYTKKTVEKINFCKNNNLNLISLYPDDIKQDMKGVKEKFNSFLFLTK